jgi:lysophospholipase L1-like esterase
MPEPAPVANPNPAQQKPPFGQAAAAQPTPNRGYEAAGLQRLGLVVQQLQELLPQLGSGSDAGQAVLKALTGLSKFVPPGSVTPAAQKQQLERMAQAQQQGNQQMQALAAQRQQQAPQGAAQPKAA